MLEMFIVGSFWFYAITALFVILLFVCTEKSSSFGATATIIASLLIANFLFKIPIFSYLFENPGHILVFIFLYFFLGTLWACCKWWFYVKHEKYKYLEVKRQFIKDNNLNMTEYEPMVSSSVDAWSRYISCKNIELNTKVRNHKEDIYIWISLFPFSFVWTMINDPVRKLLRLIYNGIHDKLQAVSDSIWSDTTKDFIK